MQLKSVSLLMSTSYTIGNMFALFSFQKTILSYSKQPERPVSNWETKLLAAGAIGVAVGLYVASKA